MGTTFLDDGSIVGFKASLTSVISFAILHCFQKVEVRQGAILILPELLASL